MSCQPETENVGLGAVPLELSTAGLLKVVVSRLMLLQPNRNAAIGHAKESRNAERQGCMASSGCCYSADYERPRNGPTTEMAVKESLTAPGMPRRTAQGRRAIGWTTTP